MAASAFTVYSKAVLGLSKGSFNLLSDNLVLTLHSNSYTPAPNTDSLWSDVSAYELATANGYTAGGVLLPSQTDALATATVTFSGGTVSWSTFSAGPFRYAILTRRAGASLVSGDLLLAYSDLTGSGTITGGGGTYSVIPNASGIFTLTHAP